MKTSLVGDHVPALRARREPVMRRLIERRYPQALVVYGMAATLPCVTVATLAGWGAGGVKG